MKNGNESAFAAASGDRLQAGLTKREHFAGLAMQAFIASVGAHGVSGSGQTADYAVRYADALLAALEHTTEE